MMDTLSQLPESAISIIVLFVVIGLKWLIQQYHQSKSISILGLYCQQLANKVNKENHSQGHRKVAGAIATLITFLPVVIILWLFESFIAVPWIWEALLLFISLGPLKLNHVARHEALLLSQQNKYQAKQHLAPYLLRDTEQLSPLGLTKATIETLLLRSFQQQFVIGFYFLVAGPLGAISMRLLLEMHYHWNVKLHSFISFGRFIALTVVLLQWLPGRLYLLGLTITTINRSIILYWRLTRRYFFQLNNNALLSYFAYSMEIKLGGVAMYQKEKLRRKSFNDQGRQPEIADIERAIKQLNLIDTLIFGLLISYLILTVMMNK